MQIAVGKKVKHKEHGFEGVVKAVHPNGQITVLITEGENPYFPERNTYTGIRVNFEVKPKNAFEQMFEDAFKAMNEVADDNAESVENDTEEDTDDEIEVDVNGTVILKLTDGTEISFEFYSDFADFVESFTTLNK